MIPVPAEVEAALASTSFRTALLVQIPFQNGNLYLTDNDRSITVGGNTYVSNSTLILGSEDVKRDREISADAYTIRFDHADISIYQDYIVEDHVGKVAKISVAFLNPNGTPLSSSAFLELYSGLVDSWSITEQGSRSDIGLRLTSHWSAFKVVSSRYTNSASQNEMYPGDTFFEFSYQEDLPTKWGL
jgi:hypothetical protein